MRNASGNSIDMQAIGGQSARVIKVYCSRVIRWYTEAVAPQLLIALCCQEEIQRQTLVTQRI